MQNQRGLECCITAEYLDQIILEATREEEKLLDTKLATFSSSLTEFQGAQFRKIQDCYARIGARIMEATAEAFKNDLPCRKK